MALMQELNRTEGLTFMIVTHDSGIAARCHRTIYMQDGGIARDVANAVPAGGVR
jgi:predicted ABC-type transport system involved in lysophospholipase L1 biosynthesis ATPase subunit